MTRINWADLGERAGWTFVQGFAGVVAAAGSSAAFGGVDWRAALIGAATAAVLSVLKSLGLNLSGTATAGAAQALTTDVVDALGEAIGGLVNHTHPASTPLVERTQTIPVVTPAPVTPSQPTGPQPLPVPPVPAPAPAAVAQPSGEASIAALSAQSARG